MNGLFNIAVAEFGQIGSDGKIGPWNGSGAVRGLVAASLKRCGERYQHSHLAGWSRARKRECDHRTGRRGSTQIPSRQPPARWPIV